MSRARLAILAVIFACCTGFRACVFVSNPISDHNVAVNHDWIVTGTNTSWTFTPVPNSGNANLTYHATPAYFSTPGHPCEGLTLYGEPMVYADPVDGRFWFHINDGRSGCLFASAGPDPRGPFIKAYVTPVADGLWLTVTRDKVVLMGFTVPLHVNALVFNRGDLIQSVASPHVQTLALAYWSHPIHNKTVGPYQNDAWLMGRAPVKADGRRVIQFTKITGVPGIGTGAVAKAYDVPLPSNDMPFMEPTPESATQPDGSVVHFPNGTPGMWTNAGATGTGLAYIFQAGAPNGVPRLGLYGFDMVSSTDGPRWVVVEQIEPPPLGLFNPPGAAYGCPTLAVLQIGPTGQRPILGISGAAPGYWLSAFQMGYGGLWFSTAEGVGPAYSPSAEFRLDFCVGTTTADPLTTCHVQPYLFATATRAGSPAANTYCTDRY